MQNTKLLKKINAFVKDAMDTKRYEHSIRVAETAEVLCKRYGENPNAGYLAGLSHDMCKQCTDSFILKCAKKDGLAISYIEKDKPSLLHGRAAAILLNERFFSPVYQKKISRKKNIFNFEAKRETKLSDGLFDDREIEVENKVENEVVDREILANKEQVLEAIRWHTFGNEKLSNLAKIIYIADKIEPGRSYEAKSLLDKINDLSLNDLAKEVIQDAIAYLERKKKDISLSTLRFYEELVGESHNDFPREKN